MKHIFIATVLLLFSFYVCYAAPVDNKDLDQNSKSAFGPAFDEIVVESSLTVKRKPGNRLAKKETALPATVKEEKKINKRQVFLSEDA